MIANALDEDVDDLLIVLDGTQVKDYEVIKRFSIKIDMVKDKWPEVQYLYDTWVDKEGYTKGWVLKAKDNVPSGLHHIPVTIDDRMNALYRMEGRSQSRKLKWVKGA